MIQTRTRRERPRRMFELGEAQLDVPGLDRADTLPVLTTCILSRMCWVLLCPARCLHRCKFDVATATAGGAANFASLQDLLLLVRQNS